VKLKNLVLLTLAICQGNRLMASGSPRERFLTEAPPAWARIAAAIDAKHLDIEIEFERTWTSPDGRTGGGKEDRKWKSRGDDVLVVTEHTDGDHKGESDAWAVCESYSYLLRRPTASAEWSITHFGNKQGAYVRKRIGDGPSDDRIALFVGWHFLPDWLKEPTLVIEDVKEDGDRIAVRFQYSPPPGFRHNLWYAKSGTLWFAPSQSWLPVREVIELHTGNDHGINKDDISLEYRDSDQGIPVPKRLTDNCSGLKGDLSRARIVRNYVKYDFCDVPDSAFRLAAFGIPEPTPGHYLWFFILNAAILVTLGIAFRVIYLRRKQRARACSATPAADYLRSRGQR
jgi:hypothetical protein